MAMVQPPSPNAARFVPKTLERHQIADQLPEVRKVALEFPRAQFRGHHTYIPRRFRPRNSGGTIFISPAVSVLVFAVLAPGPSSFPDEPGIRRLPMDGRFSHDGAMLAKE